MLCIVFVCIEPWYIFALGLLDWLCAPRTFAFRRWTRWSHRYWWDVRRKIRRMAVCICIPRRPRSLWTPNPVVVHLEHSGLRRSLSGPGRVLGLVCSSFVGTELLRESKVGSIVESGWATLSCNMQVEQLFRLGRVFELRFWSKVWSTTSRFNITEPLCLFAKRVLLTLVRYKVLILNWFLTTGFRSGLTV